MQVVNLKEGRALLQCQLTNKKTTPFPVRIDIDISPHDTIMAHPICFLNFFGRLYIIVGYRQLLLIRSFFRLGRLSRPLPVCTGLVEVFRKSSFIHFLKCLDHLRHYIIYFTASPQHTVFHFIYQSHSCQTFQISRF